MLHEVHKRQVGEVMDVFSEGPEGLYKRSPTAPQYALRSKSGAPGYRDATPKGTFCLPLAAERWRGAERCGYAGPISRSSVQEEFVLGQRWLVFLVLVVLCGLTGCAPDGSEKGGEEEQGSPETTQQATSESTREATREHTREATRGGARETTREKVADEEAKAPSPAPTPTSAMSGDYDATVRVSYVVDGDTVDVSPAVEGIERVRLIGVDTPETRECPGGQPLSQEAKAFTTSELQGQEVGLEFDVERMDRYDRLLAYVYPSDGEMFNETLLEEGYAQVATFPPNTRYADRFEAAQGRARAAGLGIWMLSSEQQAQLEDRGNGIGGEGCTPVAPPPPPPAPQPAPDTPSVPDGGGIVSPVGNSCPPNAPIKGNQSGIYHVPSGEFYGRTNPEECFASESDAVAAGYRASKR